MEELLLKLPGILESASVYLSVLVVMATALVRIPGLNKYSKDVSGVVGFINRLLSWLPTIGVNPRTQELEEKANNP